MAIPIIDLHQDVLLPGRIPEEFLGVQTSAEMLLKSSVQLVVATVYPAESNFTDPVFNEDCFSAFEEYEIMCESGEFRIVKNFSDVAECMSGGVKGLLLHVEGIPRFEDSEECWNLLERMYERGLRSVGLFHNELSAFGGGTNHSEVGLTELGRKMIEWCLAKKVIVDCAHMSRRSFDEAARLLLNAGLPIFVSHGNVASVYEKKRNYTDEQIEVIAKSGGVLGMFFSAKNTSEKEGVGIDDLLEHIRYVVKKWGPKCVAVGSDFGGITSQTIEGLESVLDLEKLEEKFLEEFSREEVEMILRRNAERVIGEFLGR
jgi:membrane dipeptidase